MSSDLIPYCDIERMAAAMVQSNLFGFKTLEQAISLMLIAQAEGLHPASAARDYDIIQGRPALKTQVMMARFQKSGGKVQWVQRDDACVRGVFSHPNGGEVEVEWDMNRAKVAGILGRDNWRKYPRQMLTARVISEGVRACYPAACNGLYVPEEVADFDDAPAPKAIAYEVKPPRHPDMPKNITADLEEVARKNIEPPEDKERMKLIGELDQIRTADGSSWETVFTIAQSIFELPATPTRFSELTLEQITKLRDFVQQDTAPQQVAVAEQ